MKTTIKDFTKQERKSLTIYKSHKLAGGFYKVKYAIKNLEQNTITSAYTKTIENVGGVKASLLNHLI